MTHQTTHAVQHPVNRSAVLFAISDDPVCQLISAVLPSRSFPYSYQVVATLSEAHAWLVQHTPLCIVMTVDIALGSGDNTSSGLIALLPPRCPTVSLLQRRRDVPTYPAYLYLPGTFHDWCTMPFEIDELLGRIQHTIMRAQ